MEHVAHVCHVGSINIGEVGDFYKFLKLIKHIARIRISIDSPSFRIIVHSTGSVIKVDVDRNRISIISDRNSVSGRRNEVAWKSI